MKSNQKTKFLIIVWLNFYCFNISFSNNRVLFIGNSYTYYNSLPQIFKNIALDNGIDTEVSSSHFPAFSLEQHFWHQYTLDQINQGNWDFVVLQDFSQRPSNTTAFVKEHTFRYAQKLDSLIHIKSPKATIVFYMTWGRRDGDAQFCKEIPENCTFEGMTNRLEKSYLTMGQMFDARVAPVGLAFKECRNRYSDIELYDPDGSHPSKEGSYLAANVIYHTINFPSIENHKYLFDFPEDKSKKLQAIAFETVNQNLEKCRIIDSRFSVLNNQNDVFTLTANSKLADEYKWVLNDSIILSKQNIAIINLPYGKQKVKLILKAQNREFYSEQNVVNGGTFEIIYYNFILPNAFLIVSILVLVLILTLFLVRRKNLKK